MSDDTPTEATSTAATGGGVSVGGGGGRSVCCCPRGLLFQQPRASASAAVASLFDSLLRQQHRDGCRRRRGPRNRLWRPGRRSRRGGVDQRGRRHSLGSTNFYGRPCGVNSSSDDGCLHSSHRLLVVIVVVGVGERVVVAAKHRGFGALFRWSNLVLHTCSFFCVCGACCVA